MSTVRRSVRTQPTESEPKRDVFKERRAQIGRATRAESAPFGPLLEYISPSGGTLKWCNLYFGGEFTAGL
jgi:hypothetical protein